MNNKEPKTIFEYLFEQKNKIKQESPECLVIVQSKQGIYWMFDDDADIAERVLGITKLTVRVSEGKEVSAVSFMNLDRNLKMLVRESYKIKTTCKL